MLSTRESSEPRALAALAMADIKRICFSDIDGTIMHDPSEADKDVELLVTPASVSGRRGAISAETIKKVAKLRDAGIKFVIITGARFSTLLMRLPFLPASDALVCENGGRIFYPGSHLPTACPIMEDEPWREGAGPSGQDTIDPSERKGALWDWYRQLKEQGWTLDASGYTTSFRAHAKDGKSLDDLHAAIALKPAALSCTFNLGAADFYPATSGKAAAARYLMKKWGIDPKDSVFLCDDHNDMELAAEVGKAFLPSISSESVTAAVAARPEQFVVATARGTAASEEMLDAIVSHYGLFTKAE